MGGAQRGGVAVPGELAGEGGAVLVGPAGRVLGVAAGGAGGLEIGDPEVLARLGEGAGALAHRVVAAGVVEARSDPHVEDPGQRQRPRPGDGQRARAAGREHDGLPVDHDGQLAGVVGHRQLDPRGGGVPRGLGAHHVAREVLELVEVVGVHGARGERALGGGQAGGGLVDAPQPLGEVGELGAVAGGGHRALGRVGGPAGLARPCARRGVGGAAGVALVAGGGVLGLVRGDRLGRAGRGVGLVLDGGDQARRGSPGARGRRRRAPGRAPRAGGRRRPRAAATAGPPRCPRAR